MNSPPPRSSVNKIYYGDNLTIMRKIADESVDLIYLDPPFNSKKNYNLIYKTATGLPVPEQAEAFCDSWEMDDEKWELVQNMRVTMKHYEMDASFIEFWHFWIEALKNSNRKLLAYLVYMTARLLEMRRLLKPTGSLYLHCDPTASHYIKIILDSIFGHKNFRNEIIWYYKNGGGRAKRWFNKKHDIIFWYSKTDDWVYDIDKLRVPYEKTSAYATYGTTHHNTNKKYMPNKKGKNPDDVFVIGILNISAKERLGYPTQKPIALLDRIIKASCPPGGVVLDPFCGCGTTLYAAHEINKRRRQTTPESQWCEQDIKWIGIDIAILATNLVHKILHQREGLKQGRDYEIEGIPFSEEAARYLWKQDPHQFQNWAVEYVNGFCTLKKSHDKGIDGKLYFYEKSKDKKQELKHMIISVKGGKLKAQDVRDLIGVMEREKKNGAVFGGLISFDPPSREMKQEAVEIGSYEDQFNNRYSKLQFLTVKEMMEEKKLFNVPLNVNRVDVAKNRQERFYLEERPKI